MPAFAVPKAAPTAIISSQRQCHSKPPVKKRTAKDHLFQSNLNSFLYKRKTLHLRLMRHLQTQRKAQKVDKETWIDIREKFEARVC